MKTACDCKGQKCILILLTGNGKSLCFVCLPFIFEQFFGGLSLSLYTRDVNKVETNVIDPLTGMSRISRQQ